MQTAFALPAPVPMPALIAPPMVPPTEPAAGTKPAPLLLFGIDDRGRPHGACFVVSETAAVERAADLMDLYFVAAETDALRELGLRLPKGRLFESGKAFVPFIKATLYGELLAAAGISDLSRPTTSAGMPLKAAAKAAGGGSEPGGGNGSPAKPGSSGSPPEGGAPQRPTDWPEIGRGSHVLACHAPMEGWFEAVVLYTKAVDRFVLRWRDWPDEPEIVRARNDLGLLPPESRAGIE